jgi:hypothetical protein
MRERIEKAVSADTASRRQNFAAGLIGNLAAIDGGGANQLAARRDRPGDSLFSDCVLGDSLFDELGDCGFQVGRLEAEWSRLALIGDASVCINEIEAVGPSCVSTFGGVPELVEHGGKFDSKFADARACKEGPFLVVLGTGEDKVLFDVVLRLPDIARMSFKNINN